MPAQIFHIIVGDNPQIAQWLNRGFFHNFFNIHLLLFPPLVPHPDFDLLHGQSPPVRPGIIPGQFPNIQIHIIPGAIFCQGKSVAVEDQSTGGREKNGDGRLVDEGLGMFLPVDDLDNEKSLQKDQCRQADEQHGRRHTPWNICLWSCEQHHLPPAIR